MKDRDQYRKKAAPPTARATTASGRPGLRDAVTRDRDPDRRPLARLARDLADPAEQPDALAHAEEAEVAAPRLGRVLGLAAEPLAVVAHDDLQIRIVLAQLERDPLRAGVPPRVVQRLDRRAVERGLGVGPQRADRLDVLVDLPARLRGDLRRDR